MSPARRWLSWLLLFGGWSFLHGGAEPAGPCIGIAGSQIRAGDLAGAVPLFASIPGDTFVALAPAPGARRLLRPAMLEAFAAHHGLVLSAPAPSPNPAPDLCIERITHVLREEELRESLEGTLKQALPADRVEIEILDFSRYPVPAGPVEFSPAGLAVAGVSRPEQPVIWKGCVREPDSRRSVPVWVRVRLTTLRPALEAVTPLLPGKPLTAAQIRPVDRKTFAFTKASLSQVEQAVGLMPKRLLRPGVILRSEDLMPRREVEAGDVVSISVSAGALELKLPGKAESGGTLGDAVAVRSAATGRRFRATVNGPARVRVETPTVSITDDFPELPQAHKESKP